MTEEEKLSTSIIIILVIIIVMLLLVIISVIMIAVVCGVRKKTSKTVTKEVVEREYDVISTPALGQKGVATVEPGSHDMADYDYIDDAFRMKVINQNEAYGIIPTALHCPNSEEEPETNMYICAGEGNENHFKH